MSSEDGDVFEPCPKGRRPWDRPRTGPGNTSVTGEGGLQTQISGRTDEPET